MTTDNDGIIDKVQALLRMTKARGATENEAATALKMAHALLTKHNLTMEQVGEIDTKAGEVVEDWTAMTAAGQGKAERTGKPGWQGLLAFVIGKHFYVKVLFATTSGSILFVGRPANIATVKELHRWTMLQVTSIALDACREAGLDPVYEPTWMRSCRMGMVERIDRRLHDIVAEAQAREVKVTALVVALDREIDEFIAASGRKLVDGRDKAEQIDHEGLAAGRVVGERVSLSPGSRQVEGRN